MANTDFGILLKTLLDKSGINSELEQVQKIVNKYTIDIMPELKTASLKNQMKAVSQEIANDFNKAFGTNLTGNDVFKAFENQAKQAEKAVKEEAKAIETARKEQESLTNAIAKGREQAELSRQAEQKRQQIAQNNAINKALEQEYLEREKITEAIAKGREKSEKARQTEEKRQQIAQNNAINKALEEEYKQRQKNIEVAKKQAELDRQNALAFTKSASERLSSAISKYSYGDTSDANAMMKQMNRGLSNFGDLSNVQGNITQLSSTVDKIVADLKLSHEQSLQALNQEIKAEQTLQSQKDAFNKKNINAIDYEIQKREEEAKAFSSMLQAQMQEQQKVQSEVNKIQHSLSVGDYDVQVASLTSKFEKWGLSAETVSQKMSELNIAYRNLQNANTDDKRLQAEKVYQQALEKTKNELTLMSLQSASISDRTNLSNKIQVWLDKNTKASEKARTTLQGYIATLNSSDEMGVPALQKIKNEFTQIEIAERSAGRLGKSFIDTLKAGARKFAEWGLASNAVMTVWNKSKEMVQAVYDIDTAMTNLYKVTDETAERYDQFLDSASKKAKELGQSVTNLVEQTANWAKLGYSLDDAGKLAEISSIYSNVGEVDNDTAVSDMVTAMKAFNIEASDAITIVDRLNALGNKYATSASALGTGLSNSASSLALAGNSIDETLAMITAMTEITQDASESGNALKILSMRLRGMKGELEALGEESEGLESISKIQTQILNLTGGKVNIFGDDGNFKSTYEIMQGISEVWTEISQTDQAALLEIIAGI